MNLRRTPIASAVALAMMGAVYPALAQQTEPPKPDDKSPASLEGVVIKGIRASLQQSLDVKRSANSVVEVITAEDVGKMPDKNVADSLQRVPGVTISSASASEGGFDENDRVSLRGTNPSLTLTLINGHMIGSGDWFVLNQVGTVGRSVSYSLLPSELVGQVRIYKSARADLIEGGVAGTVDILTRRPLDYGKSITAEASAGLVYSDLPDKTDPQFSALFNWKNDANNVGVLVQAFFEKRHLRRDGQETLGYSQISPTSTIVTGSGGAPGTPTGPHPDLANVYYPNVIGSALFEQVRERKGGLIDFQIKPINSLTLDFSGFYSKLEATNYNRNWMLWPSRIIGTRAEAPTTYTVTNGTLTSAIWPNVPGNQYAIVDQIYRPGANSDTKFFDFDARFRATDTLTLTSKIGIAKGKGETPTQAVFEGDVLNTGAAYSMHGVSAPINTSVRAGDPSNFSGTALDWVFGASPAKTNDQEKYGQIDGDFHLDLGPMTHVKTGLRLSEHKRDTVWIAQGPNFAADPFNPANLPRWNGETYPANFGSGLGGGGFLTNVWQISPNELERWGNIYSNRDPVTREFFAGEFALKEDNQAAFVMAEFDGSRWSGHAGVRLVKTGERVTTNVAIPQNPTGNPATPNDCAPLSPCSVPGAITTSAFGAFYRKNIENDYTDVLPSVAVKFDLTRDLALRAGVSRTMARPDFSALGGAISLEDTNRTGNGGNPNLKPIRSNNVEGAVEWYFAPRSLLSLGLFYMDLKNYVSFGTFQATFRNIRTNTDDVYTISAPTNSKGKVQGAELSYVQPFASGFGLIANYTYADAEEDGGRDLVGASQNTYNIVGYFENNFFNARLAYAYRSKFFNGLDRSTAQYQDDTATLSAALGFTLTKNLSLTFEARNLNNPTLRYYALNREQPTAFYSNGRQYYLTLRGQL
jgi:iron complex outermembrane receptor protein